LVARDFLLSPGRPLGKVPEFGGDFLRSVDLRRCAALPLWRDPEQLQNQLDVGYGTLMGLLVEQVSFPAESTDKGLLWGKLSSAWKRLVLLFFFH
jgi:hypothetical protein